MDETYCARYEGCDAPLCPLVEDSKLNRRPWFPDEPVCRVRKHSGVKWLRKQKRIAALRLNVDAGYFTKPMLQEIGRVTSRVQGADPDVQRADSRWIQSRRNKAKNPQHGLSD